MRAALLASLAICCGTAQADEVWRTRDGGLVIYEADIGSTAVLSAPGPYGTVSVYVPGLGGVWGQDRRQSYDAYYIGSAEGGPCEAALMAPDERVSHDWGTARLVLTRRGFPTTILLLTSPCGGTEEDLIVGEPVVAE